MTWQAAVARALERRAAALRAPVLRLFHGPTEGYAPLTLERYGSTLVVFDRAHNRKTAEDTAAYICSALEGMRACVWKPRGQVGTVLFGTPDTQIEENGLAYAIDLLVSRDTSFYLDTAELRTLLRTSCAGETVLNAFAYTASLSVAARAAGASVVSVDKNPRYLDIGKRSFALNGWPVEKGAFVVDDIFRYTAALRRRRVRFDTVIVDPPFFVSSPRGRIDVANDAIRLINKFRPLVHDQGRLIVVANALFMPGKRLISALESLAPWVRIERIVGVPPLVCGPTPTWPADPAPFAHPTKIAVCSTHHKPSRTES